MNNVAEIISYFLKSPTGRSRSFSIMKRVRSPGTKDKYETFESEQINILNGLYSSGKKTLEATRKEFKEIIHSLYQNEKKRRGDLIACDENHIVATEYLTKKYPPKKRKEMDFKSAENETYRTLKILGTKSILSISNEDLQNCVDKLDTDLQQRYVSRLKSILTTLGRTDISLYGSKPNRKRVSHINKKDLDILVAAIKKESNDIAGINPKDFADFTIALFCTGMRIGEAIGIDPADLFVSRGYLKVKQQLTNKKIITKPKTKKERKAVIAKFGLKSVEKWVELDKSKFSRYDAAKYLSAKTKELFKDKNKHISNHGLRHSYAIYLLTVVELSLNAVATFLGDSIPTAEKYYIDFIASDETIESALRKMSKVRSK